MNKTINATLIAFADIRDTYNDSREKGATSQEAFKEVISKFPELPLVELSVALNIIECDYDRRMSSFEHAAKDVMFRAMNAKSFARSNRLSAP